MQLILTSFGVCAPLLLLVGIGVLFKTLGLIEKKTVSQISKIILKILLPISMFVNIYTGSFDNLDGKFILTLYGATIVCIIINTVIIVLTKMSNQQKSAMIQNAVRANISLFAVPLSVEVAGSGISSLTSLSAGLSTPFTNCFSIGEFEWFKPGKANKLEIVKKAVLAPIMLGSFFGFILKLANFPLPQVVLKTFTYCSNVVTPMSLMMVGASFDFSFNKSDLKKIIYCVVFKTIICPVIGILFGVLFKLNAEQLVVIMCVFASPIATSSFATANDYDTDMKLVSSTLVYSYVACIVTLPVIISICKVLGLIY